MTRCEARATTAFLKSRGSSPGQSSRYKNVFLMCVTTSREKPTRSAAIPNWLLIKWVRWTVVSVCIFGETVFSFVETFHWIGTGLCVCVLAAVTQSAKTRQPWVQSKRQRRYSHDMVLELLYLGIVQRTQCLVQ